MEHGIRNKQNRRHIIVKQDREMEESGTHRANLAKLKYLVGSTTNNHETDEPTETTIVATSQTRDQDSGVLYQESG